MTVTANIPFFKLQVSIYCSRHCPLLMGNPSETIFLTFFGILSPQVPQRYQLMGYRPVSVWQAFSSYSPPTLARPLRTGAPVKMQHMSSNVCSSTFLPYALSLPPFFRMSCCPVMTETDLEQEWPPEHRRTRRRIPPLNTRRVTRTSTSAPSPGNNSDKTMTRGHDLSGEETVKRYDD